jgi:PilZ domain
MKKPDPVAARARADRRKFRRVLVNLPGKLFVPGNGQESTCTVVDMSPGGAQIACELTLEQEMQVVLYVNGFGRFEGSVVRCDEAGYGMRFVSTALKRERTAEQLTLFMNSGLIGDVDLRRDDRTPTKGLTRFTRADGQIVPCEVLDLSMSGISVKTDMRPPIGEFVLIGQMAGRVARHHDEGIGIEFVGTASHTAERLRAKLVVAR